MHDVVIFLSLVSDGLLAAFCNTIGRFNEGDGGDGHPYWLIFFSQKAVFFRLKGIY